MIYAQFIKEPRFYELVKYLQHNFDNVEYGHQSDYWIWVKSSNIKVEIDNFTSIEFLIKCSTANNEFLNSVIDCISKKYKLKLIDPPEFEDHE